MVDGAAEGLPTESGVSRIKVGQKIRGVKNRAADAGGVVAASVGSAEIDVGRFAEVAVEAKMADNAGVLAAVGGENVTRIAPENLGRSLEEPVFRGGEETRKGDAGIVDAVFAADETVGHQRPVNERQGVVVDGVDLAEFGAHLADFQKESGRERSKGDVTFLDVHAFFAEGDKGLGERAHLFLKSAYANFFGSSSGRSRRGRVLLPRNRGFLLCRGGHREKNDQGHSRKSFHGTTPS